VIFLPPRESKVRAQPTIYAFRHKTSHFTASAIIYALSMRLATVVMRCGSRNRNEDAFDGAIWLGP